MSALFKDRADAGRQLAEGLAHYGANPDVLVLGLPRGGVPVAFEVAQRLGTPLDVFAVRKLGVPGHEELAVGAVASGGARVLNREVMATAGLGLGEIEVIAGRALATLERQEQSYRGHRAASEVRGKTVILIDDGLATGATMRAAIEALRSRGAARIVTGVPVAPRETCTAIASEVDEMVCTAMPDEFTAVGLWYRDFSPVSDERVRQLLDSRTEEG